MKYLTFLIVFVSLLSGCASTPPNNPWIGLNAGLSPATTPLDCGKFPIPSEVVDTGVIYNKAALNDLDAYRVCSEANEAIASEHALQIHQLKFARKGLTEAGQAQRRIADMKQEMLDDERKHNFFEKIGLYVVILGMGVAL